MEEINKYIGNSVIEYTEREKFPFNLLSFKIWWNKQTNTESTNR